MRKLRVLHCLETVGSGGVEQLKLIKARQLDKNRYEQALICTQAIGSLPAEFARADCPVHEIGVFSNIFDFERYARAHRVVREFKPDIIHGAVYEGVATAAITGTWARVPAIIGEETSDPVGRRLRGHLLYRTLAALTHQMVAVSPSVRDYLVHGIKIPKNRVTLINNCAMEPPAATAEEMRLVRGLLNIKPDDVIIGCCCRLFDEHKRVSDLIKAFARVHALEPKSKLLIVGDGPDKTKLCALAGELGIAEHVFFVGYQGNTRPFFEVMDIFALASAYEGLPVALLEAMFARLPVVATRVSGIPSVVTSEAGFLVSPKAPDELADKLLVLIGDPALRKSMGEAGLQVARASFSADRYVREFDELYQSVAAERLRVRFASR
ncbi:glycosyltransferase [Methylocystis echinoides]|uniref:glycosyltransferase n=1 Tax=Methylocystis echinoides TaxID=29468 RepID=UPI00342A0C6E